MDDRIENSFSPDFRPRSERIALGKSLRKNVPRGSHAVWKPGDNRRDPIDILRETDEGRLKDLIPIRYGRMSRDPFTFLRGSAAVMAADLATLPVTGIKVQACGDCHLSNFGIFATPERNLVFDLNDFDETLPAPWEWDLKRLVVSFIIAGRANKFNDSDSRDAAILCTRSYREHLRLYSSASPLDIWYERLDMEEIIAMATDPAERQLREKLAAKARRRVDRHLFPEITTSIDGKHEFIENPPFLHHGGKESWEMRVGDALEDYRESLSDERRFLLDRYRLEDTAMKVVGVGSVGTRCYILLFFSEDVHPLILQIKEARRSVLEPYTDRGLHDNQGQRIVTGQRLMQSSSDIFLGWTRGRHGQDFYVRQLRDMKVSFPVEGISLSFLKRYAQYCGWTLARAHAKSGDAATISGYIGKGDSFDIALGDFALAYAEQVERDHAALLEAIESGRVEAIIEEEAD